MSRVSKRSSGKSRKSMKMRSRLSSRKSQRGGGEYNGVYKGDIRNKLSKLYNDIMYPYLVGAPATAVYRYASLSQDKQTIIMDLKIKFFMEGWKSVPINKLLEFLKLDIRSSVFKLSMTDAYYADVLNKIKGNDENTLPEALQKLRKIKLNERVAEFINEYKTVCADEIKCYTTISMNSSIQIILNAIEQLYELIRNKGILGFSGDSKELNETLFSDNDDIANYNQLYSFTTSTPPQ